MTSFDSDTAALSVAENDEAPSASGRMSSFTSAPTGKDVIYFGLILSIGHDALLAEYQRQYGDVEGENELSNQFGHVFEDARIKASVRVETFARYAPGRGFFTTRSADAADALLTEMIRLVTVQNKDIPNRKLHRNLGGVIVAVRDVGQSPPQSEEKFWAAYASTSVAQNLARDVNAGEVRVVEQVCKALSPDRRDRYKPAGMADGGAIWSRQAVMDEAPAKTINRAVMVIDMCRFSRIQANMKLMYKANGPATLHEQIVGIISGGFRAAGAASYERYMHKWGGDGGIFLFEDPTLAHRVGVEVIRQAEEQQNREARERSCEDAMRCFRVGIDFGRLDHASDTDEYSGEPLTRATRLESGGPSGELHVSEEFYQRLGEDLRRAYGDKEPIFGKNHDKPFSGRRLVVADRALWPEVGHDNKPFPPIKQPNADFPASAEPAPALESCFVICPLGDDEPRVAEVFDRLIAPACAKAGYTPRRATDLPGDRKTVIADSLWNAPLVIAYLGDPSHWNYNVILEIGLRLATRLPLIMLSDAMDDGREPDYQRLLPFQIVHDNVITVPSDARLSLQRVIEEIGSSRGRPTQSWESANPVLEFRYTTFDDVVIADANETARRVFGPEVVRKGQGVERLTKLFVEQTDAAQFEARQQEQIALIDALMAHAVRGKKAARDWHPPKARIPIVFRDAPLDPGSGKPIGYLPIIVRYHFDRQGTQVRYMYLRVSAAMHKPDDLPYYVCDL